MEHDVILKVLQANHWNRRRTAEVLKISYRALLYKVRQAGLPAKRPARKMDPSSDGLSEPSLERLARDLPPKSTVLKGFAALALPNSGCLPNNLGLECLGIRGVRTRVWYEIRLVHLSCPCAPIPLA